VSRYSIVCAEMKTSVGGSGIVGKTQGGGCGRAIISGDGSVRSFLHMYKGVFIPMLKGKIDVKGEYCNASSTEGSLRHGRCDTPFISGLILPSIMLSPFQYLLTELPREYLWTKSYR